MYSLEGVTVTTSCCRDAAATVGEAEAAAAVDKLLEAGCCGRGAGDTAALFRRCGTTYLSVEWEPADVGR